MKTIIDIPNSDTPVAETIRYALAKLPHKQKQDLLGQMSEKEFVDHRVDIYLTEIERSLISGNYAPAGAEEIALHECMGGLLAE